MARAFNRANGPFTESERLFGPQNRFTVRALHDTDPIRS